MNNTKDSRVEEEVLFNVKSICDGHHHVTYRGVKAIRCPFDYVLYQMIIFQIKPDLIIEIGTNTGGGALYIADLLNIIGNGIVHTIDIVKQSDPLLMSHPRIVCFTKGWQDYELSLVKDFRNILIIEDGSHTYEDTLGALRKFGPVVSPDSYLIVEDGIINELGMEKQYNGGPLRAIREFLVTNREFAVDHSWCDFFGKNATFNVRGYLKKRVKQVKVSICIPAYKQVDYLRNTLDSIVSQTYQDYEIIITDDSPDDSVEGLLQEYDFSGKLRYFRNQNRKGSPDNWNEAVSYATGEYIKILHHDDWFNYKESLAEFVKLLDKNPGANFAFSSTRVENAQTGQTRIHHANDEHLALLQREPTILFFGNMIGSPSATIYRRQQDRRYDTTMKWLVDLDFYIDMLRDNPIIAHSPQPLITSITAAAHTVTRECENNKQTELYEYFYLFEKIQDSITPPRSEQYAAILGNLLTKYRVKSINDIEDCDEKTRRYVGAFIETRQDKNRSSLKKQGGRKEQAVGVIFSKDRTMQLDCTLRSFMQHCKDIDTISVKVLYTTSNALHESQYHKIKDEHPSIEFIRECNFKKDLLRVLNSSEYVLFLVDDNIFVRDFFLGHAIDELKHNPGCIGFSLRLGNNTDYCYMLKKQQKIPNFIPLARGVYRYEWITAECDFGYPLEVSSSLYRTVDIFPLLKKFDYINPNTLELILDTNKHVFDTNKKSLLCFEKSVTFCNPINMVQNMWKNRAGENSSYSPERLSAMYDEGYKIDIERFSGFTPISCHQEEELLYVRHGNTLQEDPLASIIILHQKGLDNIRLNLESIRRNTPEPHEIIVFDNASTDGSREYLRSRPDIILIESPQNIGCTPARAKAMSIARGQYLILLDNDTIVTKGWLTRFIEHAQKNPHIGMMGPCSNYVSGLQLVPSTSYKSEAELEMFARNWSEQHRDELIAVFRLVGFCMFIRKELFEKIGIIDESLGFFGFDDDDYALRAYIAGFNPSIARDIFIHHTGGPQGRGDQQVNQSLLKAWENYKKKWGINPKIPYGKPYDISSILARTFDKQKHYCEPYPRSAIEEMIYLKKSAIEQDITTAGKIPSLIHPEFIQGMTSIIIPVQSIHLDECVSSIKQYTEEPHEIIFLDHGAAPKLKKQISKAVKENCNYKVIKIDRRVNFTQALNEGINQSTGEYIVLIFDDVIVCEGWLSDMIECLHRGKKIGIVGAMSNDASSLQRVEGINFKSLEERFSFRERNRYRRIHTRNLDGFCMLFGRDLLIRIGLFDEILGQDKHVFDDLCVRAVLEGYHNVIAGNVFVHNLGGINRLMSRDKTLFDEKWIGLDASTPLAEKVLIANSMETARSQYHRGTVDEAVKTLIWRAGFSPNEKQLFYQLAEMLLAENRFQEALGALKGIAAAEDDVEYHVLQGYGNEGLGFYKEAEECVDKALAMDDKSAPALNLKGILAYRKDDVSNAEEFFRQAIETADPGYGDPYTNMGMLRWKAEQQEQALDLFEKGFVLCPDKGDLITGYYSAISSLERYGRAENIFREARTAYPENKRILFLLIDILLKQDKFQEAMKEVEKAMVHFGMDTGILAAALEIRRKIGAKSIAAVQDGKAKAGPTLSVCMIVKNEERYLANCLNSLSPVADEMIVVDTGSTDKTREIAEVFGAQVYDYEWINDFAVARNHSLSKAKGDWILVMDADEVISFQDHAKLRKLISKKEKVAYNLVTRNYINKTAGDGWTSNDNTYIHEQAGRGWFPSGKVRLFPNNEKIRFENPIHELVEYSLQRIGVGRQESGIPVHHYGELDAKKATEKDAQYYDLGVKKMKESGGDFKSVWELAVQAGELGKLEESIELWHKVLGFKQREATAYFNLANHYLHLGKYEDSYDCSRKSYALNPKDQSAVLSYAMSEFLAGDINKTISALEGFLKGTDSQTSHVGLLAVAYLISGEKDRGLKYLRGLVKKKYNCVYYLKDLSKSLMAAGNLARAKSLLDTAIEIEFHDQETSALLAQCKAGAGN